MDAALAAFGAVSLAAWLGVLLHPARPWDLRPRDDDGAAPDLPQWPVVCVLVPARNEAAVLPLTLPALLQQDYPGSWHVVVVDDRSSDGTADVARGLASPRLSVVDGRQLPEGWAGKVWALEQAVAGAGEAELLLLTDADIVHTSSSMRKLVADSESRGLALDSRMALLHVEGLTERLLVPPFALFFALLYPMRWANDRRRRLAAAAGGCVLVRRSAIDAIGGFAAIRDRVIDDISLATAIKGRGLPIRLAVSEGDVRSVRVYRTLADFWRTVRRTAFTQLRHSRLLLAVTTIVLLVVFVVPPALIALGLAGVTGWLAPTLAAAAWVAASVAYLPTLRLYRLFPLWALALPVAGVLYGAMTIDSAIRSVRGGRVSW